MSENPTKRLLITLLLLAVSKSPMIWASEEDGPQDPVQGLNQDSRQKNNPVADETVQENPQDSEQASAEASETRTPEAGSESLKNRELGDAFRSFQPSEEISADNAVPFPVDI